MTRKEAITKLHWLKAELIKGTDLNEPIDMAIEALNEADKREQYGQNYEADDFVKLGVTDKNKDKVILYDAFGEKEYYPQTDLVRCKDCRYSTTKEEPIHGRWCERFALHDMAVGDMGYCSFGELAEQTNDDMFGIKDMLDKLTLRGGNDD